MAFSALGLEERILKALQEVGYTEPTPIQSAAIPPILAGQDIVGIAQTGTGKTAAFTLPLLSRLAASPAQRGIATLILAPTRELVVQIDENVRAYAKHLPLRIALVYGGVSERPQIQALRQGADIVIATPGRLIDLMGRRFAEFANLKFLVLDEADRMLDMGFLPSIQRIVQVLPRDRQTLLFSATLSREIESLIHKFQRQPKTIQIGRRSNPAKTVTQLVYEVPRHLKTPLLLHLLTDPQMNMVLAFARTKHSADRLAKQLTKSGVGTATLHSNRSQNQRLRALKDFKSGAVRVLVATDIASRGIDVDGISHVVNFDFPLHEEDYVHRIGRTGRAQAVGDAISFVTPDDRDEVRKLERFIGRGLVRKRAEGFDYGAAATPAGDATPPRMGQRSDRAHRPAASQRPAPARRDGPSSRSGPGRPTPTGAPVEGGFRGGDRPPFRDRSEGAPAGAGAPPSERAPFREARPARPGFGSGVRRPEFRGPDRGPARTPDSGGARGPERGPRQDDRRPFAGPPGGAGGTGPRPERSGPPRGGFGGAGGGGGYPRGGSGRSFEGGAVGRPFRGPSGGAPARAEGGPDRRGTGGGSAGYRGSGSGPRPGPRSGPGGRSGSGERRPFPPRGRA
jgi:ATP-dependent RNA helicase RhlE